MVLGRPYSKLIKALMYGALSVTLLTLAVIVLNAELGTIIIKLCLLFFIFIPPISITYLMFKSFIRKDHTMLICLITILVIIVSNILTNIHLILQHLLK